MRQGVGRVNVLDYLPITGPVRGIKRSYTEDLSFQEQVQLGVQMGGTTFATIVATGGYTRTNIAMAQFAAANAFAISSMAAAVVVPVIAGAAVSHVIAGDEGVQDYNQFLTEPKHMPFRTSWAIARLIENYL